MSPALDVARPQMLLALVAVPIVWTVLALLDRRRSRRLVAALGARAALLLRDERTGRRAVRRTLFALGLAAAVVAAAHPVAGGDAPDVERRGVDLVVCLDVSRSMLARDVAPDRWTHARAAVAALAARAVGDRMALVAFAGEARLLVPLTGDLASFASLVDLAEPAAVRRGGTDLGAALATAREALATRGDGGAAVVLVTDGEDLGGHGLAAARGLAAEGIPVHAVGLGTPRGSKIALETARGAAFLVDREGREVVSALDAAGLAAIAEATGGAYVDGSRGVDALVRLYEDRILPRAQATFSAATRARRPNRFQAPLLVALACFVADVALGARRRR